MPQRSHPSSFRSSTILLMVLVTFYSGTAFARVAQQPVEAKPISPATQGDVRQLKPGQRLEREISGRDPHIYEMVLEAGQYMNAVVEQRGIDVKVTVTGPDDKLRLEFNNESGKQGQEIVTVIAETTGTYRLNVQPVDQQAAAGRYEIRVAESRAATAQDRELLEARKQYYDSVRLWRRGQYDEALALGERALATRERILGPDNLDVATSLNDLGIFYAVKANHAKAELLLQRAVAIREKALGPDQPDVAASLSNLANLYRQKGEYAKVEPLLQRALAIYEKTFGKDHPSVATVLNNLANVYSQTGDYAKAEPLFQRTLAIREKVLGPDHPEVAASLNNLGLLYSDKGNYTKAESLYQRALVIREKALGPDHPLVANLLDNLAIVYLEKADYVKAEPLYQRALAIRQKALGPDHPDVARSLSHVAGLYNDRGDILKAEPLYQRALAIREKALGPDHPDVADSLRSLALLYADTGDYAKAEPLYQRSLAIFEKGPGPDNSGLAATLTNFAILYAEKGDPAKAEPLYQRALATYEKAAGPDSPATAYCLDDMARFYTENGDYAKAESLYRRALSIREKGLAPDHPDVAISLNGLASLDADQGHYAKAVAYLSRAVKISEQHLRINLNTGSERQKLRYLDTLSEQTNNVISFHAQSAPDNAAARDLAAATVLQRKGRALDAMADSIAGLRRHANAADLELIDRLVDARAQLSKLVLDGPGDDKPSEYQAAIKTLEGQIEELESAISRRSAAFRTQTQPVSLAAVRAAIPPRSALVEFFSYSPRNPRPGKADERYGKPRYVAYIIFRKRKTQWVELGEAGPIDDAVNLLRAVLRKDEDKPLSNIERDVKPRARKVNDLVMQPVRRLLGTRRRVLISPDGTLSLIPFAALVDKRGRYLVERYHFTYLTSGRDLLRLQQHLPGKQGMLIVANPDYGPMSPAGGRRGIKSGAVKTTDKTLVPAKPDSLAPIQAIDFSQIEFPPLPGTEQEARALKSIIPETTVLMRDQATKAAIKQADAPSILHVATHGFFLEDVVTGLSGARGAISVRTSGSPIRVENPLLRSGLALAGANLHKSGDDNGILTALEVSGMNLEATKLVVLSACETGIGEVKNGDGVYGLRRSLVLAGSESQMLSLWKVDDNATRDLMIGYYGRLKSGVGRSAALHQVQLKMLATPRYQHPYFWAGFIESGEWANLQGMR